MSPVSPTINTVELVHKQVLTGCMASIEYEVQKNKIAITLPIQIQLQWGSEYRTSLVFKWSKVVQKLNGPLFEW